MSSQSLLHTTLLLVLAVTSGLFLNEPQLRSTRRQGLRTDEPSITCMDTLTEFEEQHWSQYHEGTLHHANSSLELLDPLLHQLEDGSSSIFYHQGYGSGSSSAGWNVAYPDSTWTSPNPSCMYVSYYAHRLTNETIKMSVIPALYADDLDDPNNQPHCKYLNVTSDFQWVEIVVQVKLRESYLFQMSIPGFDRGEFFLIDKMAVIQGHQVDGINDVRRMCGWPQVVIPSTTQSPPSSVCSAVGSFSDPSNCGKYYVCQQYENGEFLDTVMNCPETTVWCQRSQRCENPVECPCTI